MNQSANKFKQLNAFAMQYGIALGAWGILSLVTTGVSLKFTSKQHCHARFASHRGIAHIKIPQEHNHPRRGLYLWKSISVRFHNWVLRFNMDCSLRLPIPGLLGQWLYFQRLRIPAFQS